SRPTQWFHAGAPAKGGLGIKGDGYMRKCLLAAALVIASTGTGFAQDAEAGQGVFKRLCFPCHDAGPGAKVKLGPPLNGLDGRQAGTIPGFNYSEANKTSGITW